MPDTALTSPQPPITDPAPTGAPPTGDAPTTYTLQSLGETPILSLVSDAALKDDPSLKDFKGIDGLARSYASARKLIGADPNAIIRIPADSAPQAERDAFLNKLGRPETPDKYVVPETIASKKDDLMISDETLTGFGTVAHGLGLSNKQFQGVLDWYGQFAAEELARAENSQIRDVGQVTRALQLEWGGAYDEKLNLAKAAVDALEKKGGEGLKELLNSTGLGDHPVLIRAFERLGRSMLEDELKGGGITPGGFGSRLSPDQARAEIRKLQGDPDFKKKWMDKNHPSHADALGQLSNLFEQANPPTA